MRLIQGKAADDAATIVKTAGDLTARSRTAASVPWNPAPWTNVGPSGPEARTPGLAGVLQEIVDRPDWTSGSSVLFLASGSGLRVANAFDGVAANAALLEADSVYTLPSP